MSMSGSEKAIRYFQQLDEARCNGRWHDIPEIARKVEKHAPHRKCLALTARAEAHVQASTNQLPNSPTLSSNFAELSKLIPSLLTAVDQEADYPQDAFQATVCLGWLHLALDEPGLAVARLPKDFGDAIDKLANDGRELREWTRCCVVKGVYIKGFSQEKTSTTAEAKETYSSVLPYLSKFPSFSTLSSQFRLWTEKLLTRMCLLVDVSSLSDEYDSTIDALRMFRLWSKLWDNRTGHGVLGNASSVVLHTRRRVWRAYYDTVSSIVRRDLLDVSSPNDSEIRLRFSADSSREEGFLRSRLLQRSELKRVETTYEGLLIQETKFPGAMESNEEIERWVDAVMENWRIMCGPSWTDEELGEGGKGAVGHGVLDILYRAATKTFHSVRILRYLFTVHVSLAEFDLALKAFSSYVELVTRAKDRAEESGEEDPSLDDDDTIMRTAAEAVRTLCRFGSQKEAEKAYEIGQTIHKWLRQHTPAKTLDDESHTDHDSDTTPEHSTESLVSPPALAVAYRAIGMSQAHWARLTSDATARAGLQTQATQSLRKALDPQYMETDNIESLYCLGILLAETRDVAGAVKVIKKALSTRPVHDPLGSETSLDKTGTNFKRPLKRLAMWHLLSLLLTARSEFDTAAQSCDAAFAELGGINQLFNDEEQTGTYRSEHLKLASKQSGKPSTKGVIGQIGSFEKEEVLQLKITMLAITEVLHGTNAAVELTPEILALYSRLFGDIKSELAKSRKPPTPPPPPKSAAGTIKGSIFGRPLTSRGMRARSQSATPSFPRSSITSGPSIRAATTTPTPAIQVTDETGINPERSDDHSNIFHRKQSQREHRPRTRSGSVKLQKRSASVHRSRDGREGTPTVPVIDNSAIGKFDFAFDTQLDHGSASSPTSPPRPSISSSQRRSPEAISHEKSSTGHPDQPPKNDLRLPTPLPSISYSPLEPSFTSTQEKRHKISILVEVWLFIAGLYSRAAMYDDAKACVDEAYELVQELENEISQEGPSARAFAERGWGGGKSVEELWASVWSARADLAVAQDLPHEALNNYERALTYFPDHPSAIVSLSNILLDIYCQKIAAEPPEPSATRMATLMGTSTASVTSTTSFDSLDKQRNKLDDSKSRKPASPVASPEELNRLAARDRAYGLLSSLTKLGSGWDYSEAWFSLARALEESGQIDKAKEVLWWCVELEDRRPLRHWKYAGVGGFAL